MMLNVGNYTNADAATNSNAANSTAAGNSSVSNSSGSTNVDNIITISGATAAKNAIEVLKNMLAGDTFTCEISNIKGNEITLKLNNGMSFPATLLNNTDLNVGQTVTFMVNSNMDNKVSIKPLLLNQQQAVIIDRALDASNLPSTAKNIQLVKELLNQNMSIDMNTLMHLSKETSKFPDTSIDTIVRLNKLNIPVTQENINQYEAYKSYEHSISNELNGLSKSFGDLLSAMLDKNGVNDAASLSQKLLDILYRTGDSENSRNTSNTSSNTSNLNNIINTNDTSNMNENSNTSSFSLQNSSNQADSSNRNVVPEKVQPETQNSMKLNLENNMEPISKFIDPQSRKELAQMLIDTFGKDTSAAMIQDLKSGNLSAKNLLENLNFLIKNNPDLRKEGLSKLFESKEFSEIIKLVVRDKMRITPEDVKNPDGIKEFYKRVREDISRLSDDIVQNDKSSSFSKSLDTIKNNIDFMNDLNKNMSYFQMPIKFSSSDANGELYVFTNKKRVTSQTDQLTALLHLDMENLGPLDVFIKLAGKNVSTNFCLESEEMLDFVYAHIDQLNSRLEALGYHSNFEMKVREPENERIDFVEDFLDQNDSVSVPNQLLFDTKA